MAGTSPRSRYYRDLAKKPKSEQQRHYRSQISNSTTTEKKEPKKKKVSRDTKSGKNSRRIKLTAKSVPGTLEGTEKRNQSMIGRALSKD